MRRVLAAVLFAFAAAPAAPQAAVLEPVCVPVAGACQVHVGEPLGFNTLALGALSYEYDWGLGPPELSAVPVLDHAWTTPGLYRPRLTVELPATILETASTLPVRVLRPEPIPALSAGGAALLAFVIVCAGIVRLRKGRGCR
jgi:hypothetical protein